LNLFFYALDYSFLFFGYPDSWFFSSFPSRNEKKIG